MIIFKEKKRIVPTWIDYVVRGDYVASANITNGQRITYTYNGKTVYRFVPNTYSMTEDKVYSDIDLTVEIATRGVE